MLKGEIFILKLQAINGFTSGAIASGEVTSLAHEIGNDPMKARPFVGELLAALTHPLFPGAKGTKIFGCDRNCVGKQFEAQPPGMFPANADVKKNPGITAGMTGGHG
jgi:hypothetical protein